jgi:hypothetical protein
MNIYISAEEHGVHCGGLSLIHVALSSDLIIFIVLNATLSNISAI